jgi:putative SOS response-associated peptidase YedK
LITQEEAAERLADWELFYPPGFWDIEALADACRQPSLSPPPRTGGPPVTNIRNTSSPHWRGWLKPENRCLVPVNSFAEYAPEPVKALLSEFWNFSCIF